MDLGEEPCSLSWIVKNRTAFQNLIQRKCVESLATGVQTYQDVLDIPLRLCHDAGPQLSGHRLPSDLILYLFLPNGRCHGEKHLELPANNKETISYFKVADFSWISLRLNFEEAIVTIMGVKPRNKVGGRWTISISKLKLFISGGISKPSSKAYHDIFILRPDLRCKITW